MSGVGVTQEGSEDREYCSQLFYLGQPDLRQCQIHFVVTWNIEAHLTVSVAQALNSCNTNEYHIAIGMLLDRL